MTRKRLTIGFVAVLALAVIIAWLWLKLGVGGFSTRAEPSAIEQYLATTACKMAMAERAKHLKNPVPYSDEALAQARKHWANHCAFCHGNLGDGNTEVGPQPLFKPPNVRASPAQSTSDEELYFAINRGIRLTGMPALGASQETMMRIA